MKYIHLSFLVQSEGSTSITTIQFQKISPLWKETHPLSPTPIPSSPSSQPPFPSQLLIYFLSLHVCVQSCLTLCNPTDCSPSDSSVHGIHGQEYWSRLPFPSPRHLPDPGKEPASLHWQVDSLSLVPPVTLPILDMPRKHGT